MNSRNQSTTCVQTLNYPWHNLKIFDHITQENEVTRNNP